MRSGTELNQFFRVFLPTLEAFNSASKYLDDLLNIDNP